jgi:tRNA1(Val) A37 N6-methylase TrmN6
MPKVNLGGNIIYTDKQMRPRHPQDYYPTPLALARAALGAIPASFSPSRALDPGAGNGVWGIAARDSPQCRNAEIWGVELAPLDPAPSENSRFSERIQRSGERGHDF